MDKYDADSVYDSLPRILEMTTDTATFSAWLESQGFDVDFVFECALSINEQGHNPAVAFLVGTAVAWEVARK